MPFAKKDKKIIEFQRDFTCFAKKKRNIHSPRHRRIFGLASVKSRLANGCFLYGYLMERYIIRKTSVMAPRTTSMGTNIILTAFQ